MRILVAGDTHGNAAFVTYLYEQAIQRDCVQIVQVGDFGYWTHREAGRRFVESVSAQAVETKIPFYWLHGNHDKHSLALKVTERRTVEGFIEVAPSLFYIPQGASWQWEDGHMRPFSLDNANAVTCRAFGGAYSIDKQWRVSEEKKSGDPEGLWFPEEEMSDQEMERLLYLDSSRRTLVFSHDKPRSSNPGIALKDLPECHFNQDRLQRALRAHQPAYWLHGHLHHRYVDQVRSGDDSMSTVIGLSCDDRARAWGDKRNFAWVILDIDGPYVSPSLGDND